MSCSIPSIRIIIFECDMQLKIITQNKLKVPNLAFWKSYFCSSQQVLFSVCVRVRACTVPPLPCSASWFFLQLEEDCSDCLSVCCMACGGEKQNSWRSFFFFLLSSRCKRRVEGLMWQCWLQLPWDVSWRLAGDPRAPVFQSASSLRCAQKAVWRHSLKI